MASGILLVVSLVIAAVIVNKAQQLFMKFLGADTMYFSAKKKMIAIVIVGIIVFSIIGSILGLGE